VRRLAYLGSVAFLSELLDEIKIVGGQRGGFDKHFYLSATHKEEWEFWKFRIEMLNGYAYFQK
jgi:hypothetical protein